MTHKIDLAVTNTTSAKWLPWIGREYFKLPQEQRMLIVGESHYYKPEEKGSYEKHMDENYTRLTIKENAINGEVYRTKVFVNLHRVLFTENAHDRHQLWNHIGFYNFVQRPLNMGIQERPNFDDMVLGWQTFYQLLTILKPTTCLFIGVGASNTLKGSIAATTFSCKDIRKVCKVNRTYSRSTVLFSENKSSTQLEFIKHTSGTRTGFDWLKWNAHLQTVIPEQLQWLQQVSKVAKHS